MPYRVLVAPAAERTIRKLDPQVRKKVNEDISRLSENPRPPGILQVEAAHKLYRVHAGPGKTYRVIYEIRDQELVVLVVKVDHRKQVYRRM